MTLRNSLSGVLAALAILGWAGSAWAGSGGVDGTPVAVPEPSTIAILLAAVGGVLVARSRRR